MSVAIIRKMGGLVFDAVFKEGHKSTLEVTDNPVELGNLISDHAYMLPDRCYIVAGVSDTPLKQIPNDQFASAVGRHRRAYEMLTALQREAEPFDVQTGLKLYKNMVCLDVSVEQDKDSSSSLEFTATLREVLITSTQTVKYPPRQAGATARQASKPVNRGEQRIKPITGTEATAGVGPVSESAASGSTGQIKKQSLIKKGLEILGGLS